MQENVEYLTVQEIVKQLKVTEQTVRRWIESGDLKAVKLKGSRYRVHPKDFEDFLRRQQAN